MSLDGAAIVAFLATTDSKRSRRFYEDILDLRLVEDSPFALVFDVGGVPLRIQKVEHLAPHPFTSLGWTTPDIAATIAVLRLKGVDFERFPGLEQDVEAVWTSPSGARIAWFKDPDGNLLSLTEFG